VSVNSRYLDSIFLSTLLVRELVYKQCCCLAVLLKTYSRLPTTDISLATLQGKLRHQPERVQSRCLMISPQDC
jgi:hypothetical protein